MAAMIGAVLVTAFPVMMMPVMIATGIGIKSQSPCGKSPRGFISGALHTCIQPDPSVGQGHLRAHSDSAADQGISLRSLQESGQSAMAASVGINDLLTDDFSILNVIQLELFGMAEMLKNLSIVIGNGDSHCFASFHHDVLIDINRPKFTAASGDQQPFSVNEGICDLLPCALIDRCDCCPGDIHPVCACFLRETFVIQKPKCLVLIYRHPDRFGGRYIVRGETAIDRHLFDFAASHWPWHSVSFLTFVNNYCIYVFAICQ